MDGTGEHHPKRCYPGSEGQKIIRSPSYADYRSKTIAVILLEMCYTLRREHAQE
jgi:hypothetical protein